MNQLTTRIVVIIFLVILSLGFRTLPKGNSWEISVSDPKLWLDFCETPMLAATGLPDGDPLAGIFVSFDSAVNSIVTDFNSVIGSYVELSLKASDPAYTDQLGGRRTINICFSDLPGGAGGHAKAIWENGQIVGCEILMESAVLDSAYAFILTLTHELGHCIGLDHPQETTHSIMSYYINYEEAPRLKLDDKMGTTYLYPADSELINEKSTFGLSCSI